MLDKKVSLGIVEMLLNPSDSFTDEHNAFVSSIPPHVKELVSAAAALGGGGQGRRWAGRAGACTLACARGCCVCLLRWCLFAALTSVVPARVLCVPLL